VNADPHTHCMELVRLNDKDRFLATLYAPAAIQNDLFALYAFRQEIARIRFAVSDAQLGEIRLQWWRDTLNSLHEPQAHPIAGALAVTTKKHSLPVNTLHALIDAHAFDFYADTMPSMTALEAYLGETQSAIFHLASLVAAPLLANPLLSGFGGVAYGLAQLLQFPEENQKFLPTGRSIEDLTDLSRTRLSAAQAQKLSSNLLPVFLPIATTRLYLKQPGSVVPAWRRQWAIWRAARAELL
jgi:15-cis-phytoene synthase